jgi:hypothetical protein
MRRRGREGIGVKWSTIIQTVRVGGRGGGCRGGWFSESSDVYGLRFSTVGHCVYSDFLHEKVCGGSVWKDPVSGLERWVYQTRKKAAGVCALCAVIVLGQSCPEFPAYFVSSISKKALGSKSTYTIAATVSSVAGDIPLFHLVREGGSYWLYFPVNGLAGSRCFLSYWNRPPVVGPMLRPR